MNDEIAKLDAQRSGPKLIRRGRIRPVDLVQAAIDRIERPKSHD